MNAVVLVAGGSGSRMGTRVPKQYLDLEGKPLIIHTIEKFYRFDPQMVLVLVLATSHRKIWEVISNSFESESPIELATGGETRFHSVKKGLELIDDGCIVGIHDAVRPFVSQETIERCYSTAAAHGSAIPVLDMNESVRMTRGKFDSMQMDRSKLKRVQTPQVFRSEMIRKAYQQASENTYTDDASVFESAFGRVTLVKGNPENIKITTHVDLELAKILIRQR